MYLLVFSDVFLRFSLVLLLACKQKKVCLCPRGVAAVQPPPEQNPHCDPCRPSPTPPGKLKENKANLLSSRASMGGSWYTAHRDHALAQATKTKEKPNNNQEQLTFPYSFGGAPKAQPIRVTAS